MKITFHQRPAGVMVFGFCACMAPFSIPHGVLFLANIIAWGSALVCFVVFYRPNRRQIVVEDGVLHLIDGRNETRLALSDVTGYEIRKKNKFELAIGIRDGTVISFPLDYVLSLKQVRAVLGSGGVLCPIPLLATPKPLPNQ